MSNVDKLFSDLFPGEVKFIVNWHKSGKSFTSVKFGYKVGQMKKRGFKNTFKIMRRGKDFQNLSEQEWKTVREKYYSKDE